jgi:hypothetical protein
LSVSLGVLQCATAAPITAPAGEGEGEALPAFEQLKDAPPPMPNPASKVGIAIPLPHPR